MICLNYTESYIISNEMKTRMKWIERYKIERNDRKKDIKTKCLKDRIVLYHHHMLCRPFFGSKTTCRPS